MRFSLAVIELKQAIDRWNRRHHPLGTVALTKPFLMRAPELPLNGQVQRGVVGGYASMVTVVADREADIHGMPACRPGSGAPWRAAPLSWKTQTGCHAAGTVPIPGHPAWT
ncbi:MAG: hypothetical protein OXD45_11100 [Rhodobacteraceae bacterium]|nr:hypothetical protein [Paracoccaceae bacterium]MCY4307870.1 hypothetical protein [Paracoccaceae bacterium]